MFHINKLSSSSLAKSTSLRHLLFILNYIQNPKQGVLSPLLKHQSQQAENIKYTTYPTKRIHCAARPGNNCKGQVAQGSHAIERY
jgi:hypothetical protein